MKSSAHFFITFVCICVFVFGALAPVSAAPANGPLNKYGFPYDPNAVIGEDFDNRVYPYWDELNEKHIYIRQEIDRTRGELHFTDNVTENLIGNYDYKNQCWLLYGDELKNCRISINEYFFDSIDLTKTFLNRDRFGTAYNMYGLPYDPDAVFDMSYNNRELSFGSLIAFYEIYEDDLEKSLIRFIDTDYEDCGLYILGQQCWTFYNDEILNSVDISQFYTSVDLSKTTLNRDWFGNPVPVKISSASRITKRALEAVSQNEYGLKYDPNAVVDKSKDGTYLGKVKVIFNKWQNTVELDYTTYDYGIYDYKNQCWIEYTDAMKNAYVDLSQLFTSVNLSKEELNRDIYGNPVTSNTEVAERTGYIGSNTDGKFLHFYGDMPNPDADHLGGYDVYMSISDDYYAYFCKTINGQQKIFACYNFSKQYWYYRAGYDGRPAINGEKFNSSAVDPSKLYQQCDPRIDYNRTKPAAGIEFADINETLGYTYNVTNYNGEQKYFDSEIIYFDSEARLAVQPGAAVTVGKYTARLSDNYGYEYGIEKNGVQVGQYDARLQKWQTFSPDLDVTDKDLSSLFSEIDSSVNLSRLTEKPSDYSYRALNPGVVWVPVIAEDEYASGLNLTNVLADSRRLSNGVNLSKYNEASGKPKVLLFFNRDYEGSKDTVMSIRDSLSSFDGVDLLLLGDDGYSQEEFRWEYGSSAMKMYFANFTDLQQKYMSKLFSYYTSSGVYPFAVYIDSNNKIQYMEYAPELSAADLQNSIDRFLGSGGGFGVFYDSTAVADTSLKKLGKYTLNWSKTYVTFSERENGRDIIKACYNHCYQYWEYRAGKSGYFAGTTTFDESSVDLSMLYKKVDKSVKLSRKAPEANELKPLLAKITYSGTKCSVGDIILQDGTAVSPKTYRANSRNPAIGVVAFFRDVNFPNSNDAGTQTGNIEDAVIIGAKRDIKALIVSEKRSNFFRDENYAVDDMLSYVPIYDIVSERSHNYDVAYLDRSAKSTYTPESDTDGSNNYKIIKAAFDEACATNPDFKMFGKISYPAFEAAENYGKTNNISGTFRNGWYVPTYAEIDYIVRNKETVNNSLAKINGADSFTQEEMYVAYVQDGVDVYSYRQVKYSSVTDGNTFSSSLENYTSLNNEVSEPEQVYFLRNYADIDAFYSGRPANILSQGTYGEKSEPNAVGDIVFTDGSATSLRDGLILTSEQKKAVMALAVFIGDGFVGEEGYLYLASKNRNNNLSIINDEMTPLGNNEKSPRIPITYDNLIHINYPFEGDVYDAAKNWESIKKTIPWATGVKDRNGDYIKGFLQFMYADLYGSGKVLPYSLNPMYSANSIRYNITTPKLDGRYSSGWYIPSYSESKLLSWSLNRYGEQFTSVTGSDILNSGALAASDAAAGRVTITGSNRTIWLSWSTLGFLIEDLISGSDVVFHKAGKVNQGDLSLSPADLGPDRCYVGDIVLADGAIVRMDEYDYNPKNPAIGVVAFFKDKPFVAKNTGEIIEYTGTKENAVIVGLKMHEGTWSEAKDYAANYGKKNSITGIYKDDWYLPNIDERFKIDDQLISKSFAKIGKSVEATLLDDPNLWLWSSSLSNGYPLIARNHWIEDPNALYYTVAIHNYIEPGRIVEIENNHGMVTDRTHPYKVGDIVLSDGSIVSAAQYKANTRNPAVGVIAFFKDSSFPNAGNYGSRTGTKENAYIIGLKQKQGVIQWATKSAQGLKDIKTLQSYPSSFGYGAANSATFYNGSDNDGSDNWSQLCAAVTDDNISGRYPAFEYTESYGKTAGITGSYSSGWYLPTIAELSYVYRNKRYINESLELIDGATRVNGALYRSSSQDAFDGGGTFSMNGITGTIEYESKTMDLDGHGVLVVRPLSTSYKAPVQWFEPVVKSKTAENQLLKRSYSGQIGQKSKPTAVGDIIFSDGSATAYSPYLSLTQKQKEEAVAIAAFVGDGKIGQKGKIYGISLLSEKRAYYVTGARIIWYDGYTWCNGYGKTIGFTTEESFASPHISGCYPNGKTAIDGVPEFDKITYFTGDCDGSDYWSEICKIDPYGAENAETVYPAWNFVNSLGEGWYIGSAAEMWMVLKNEDIINKARAAFDCEKLGYAWTSSYTGSDLWPIFAQVRDDTAFSHEYDTYGLYAFDMGDASTVVNTAQTAQVSQGESEADKNGFVLVEGGTFRMGNASGGNDEKPVHSVTVSSFYMCDHEVTQAEYKAVMGTNPSSFSGNNKPVEQVSWYDAIEYCNALSKKEGLKACYTKSGNTYTCDWSANGYRLPTEAEWEYAARGGSKAKGYTYSGGNTAVSVAWTKDNSGNTTHDVKTKNANELGLYDMSGNVSEWVWDWYGNYGSTSQTNPRGSSSGSYRGRRGGSWGDTASNATVSYRDGNSPNRTANTRGFRVARSAK